VNIAHPPVRTHGRDAQQNVLKTRTKKESYKIDDLSIIMYNGLWI
jgi:hypothetical protein